MKSIFGRTYGIPRLRGLGVISTEAAQQLSVRLSDVEALHIDVRRYIDAAAAQDFDTVEPTARADELGAGLDRLRERLTAVDEASVDAWSEELDRIASEIGILRDQIRSNLGQASETKLWRVGLWAGGAAIATVGLVVWIRSRRRA